MKKLSLILLTLCSGLFFACTPPVNGGDDELSIAFAAEGGSQDLSITFVSSWSIVSELDWLTVAPMSGAAGETKLTVTSTANPGVEARVGQFYILDGARMITVTVTQECADAIVLDSEVYYAPMDNGTFTISVGHNVNFTVSTDSDWITPVETKAYGVTDVAFNVVKNPSSDDRSAKVTFKGTVTQVVTVVQSGWIDVDWETGFFKRSLAVRFTACWCGNCPRVGLGVKKAQGSRPDRLVEFAVHEATSDDEKIMPFWGSDDMEKFYKVKGWPTLYIDNRVEINPNSVDAVARDVENIIDESISGYAPHCGIAIKSQLSNGTISVNAQVFADKGGSFKLGVVVLEDGIEMAQHDYDDVLEDPDHYIHNNVVRDYMTDLSGDEFLLSDRSLREFSYSKAVPEKTVDPDNLKVAVYIIRTPESDAPAAVANVRYVYVGNTLIDNIVCAPIGETVEIKYAE